MNGCGAEACGLENAWMSLMSEKSPTVSGEMAVGTLIGMGMPL